MPETLQTTDFLLLGLGASLVLGLGYLALLWQRQRNLARDLETLESLRAEQPPTDQP